MAYIWENNKWPEFRWNSERLFGALDTARFKQGQLLGNMARLGFDLRLAANVQAVTEEIVKTSEIEGESLSPDSVRSSVARKLGLAEAGVTNPEERKVEAVVDMMLDATRGYGRPLTRDRVFGWHAALFPTGFSGFHKIRVAAWRDDSGGPMQVVSGAVGKERVHYEGPSADRVPQEMDRFLEWFNRPPSMNSLLRSALAHLWFVTVHPLDDGNGRIGRAVAEMALAQLEQSPQRFYSVSSQIRRERTGYYDILEQTQKGSMDVTPWFEWFLGCFARALDAAEVSLSGVLRRADFWRRNAPVSMNERQRRVVNRLLEDFEGALTAKKWAALAKCSIDTAQRDLADLVEKGLVRRNPGGSRKTSYALITDPAD